MSSTLAVIDFDDQFKAKEVRLKLDCHGNAAYCMNIESEESTMNRESQSLKVVAGASAAHAQQIPIPQYGCPSHWPGSASDAQGVGVCHPAKAKSPLKNFYQHGFGDGSVRPSRKG